MAITTAIAAAVATLTGIGVQLQGAKAAANGAGEFDFSFDREGLVQTQLIPGSTTESVEATAIGFNNRPVLAADNNDNKSWVVRLTSNGRLDRSFGGDGRAFVDLDFVRNDVSSSIPVDIAVDYANRPIVLTQVTGGEDGDSFVLTRFTSTGELDLTFDAGPDAGPANDGSIVGIYPGGLGSDSYGNALALDEINGIYYVVGSEVIGGETRAAIARFSTDGWNFTPDIFAPQNPADGYSEYVDVVIDSANDNDPIVVGNIHDATMNAADVSDPLVQRFDRESGAYDTAYAAFDGNGRIGTFNSGFGETAFAADVRDGYLAVATGRNVTGVGAKLYKLDRSGFPQNNFNSGEPVDLKAGLKPNAVKYDNTGSPVVVGQYSISAGVAEYGIATRIGDDGLVDTSFNPGVGEQLLNFGGETNTRPTLAIDRAGRAVIGHDNGTESRVFRLTSSRGEGPTLGNRILFDDLDETGMRSIYGMAPDASDVVLVADEPGASYERPVANQNGLLYYERHQEGAVDVMEANASDGSGAHRLLRAGIFEDGERVFRPTVSLSTGSVAVLVDDAVETCVFVRPEGQDYAIDGRVCGVTDAALNPYANVYAFVRDGDIWLNEVDGYNAERRVLAGVGATRVEWGYDGRLLLFDNNTATPGNTTLQTLTWANTTDVTYYDQPQFYPQPTEAETVVPPTSSAITGFAVAPEESTDFPFVYSYDNEAGDREINMAKRGDPGTQISIYEGNSARIGAWSRNFSVYPEGGPNAYLEPASVATADVALQNQSPAAQQAAAAAGGAAVESAGLLKVKLLSSPLLKLKLLSSPLLKLKLLSSGLLKLKLLSSPFGLDKFGVASDLGGSPLVQAGLQRINLAQLAITQGASWQERLSAPGLSEEAHRLARVPLQSISLAQVLALSPPIDFPALEEIDLTQSSFGTLSVTPFLLGDTRLHEIGGIDWCGVFEARGAQDCGAAYGVPGSALKGRSASLLSLQIAGFNLDDLPATDAGVNDLRTVTYGDVVLDRDRAVLPNVVLSSVDTHHLSAGSARVGRITPAPSAVVDCGIVDCTDTSTVTLDDAKRANALRPEAIVDDMGHALDSFPLNELALGLWGDPGDDPYDQPPSALGISPYSTESPGTTFVVSFARVAMGFGATAAPNVSAQTPFGYVYRPGTAEFRNSSENNGNWQPLPEPSVSNSFLRWQVPTVVDAGDHMQVRFATYATAPVDGQLIASIDDGYRWQEVGSEELRTIDQLETDDPQEAPSLEPDRLYFGRLDSATDVDYFDVSVMDGRFEMPPGSKLTVYLSQLRYDADLTVYHPTGSRRGDPLRPPGDSPDVNAVPDKAQTVANHGEPLIGEGDADVPLLRDRPLAGLSTNRGTKAERSETIVWPGGPNGDDTQSQRYLLQVSGFNGAHGPETYAIRITVTPPAAAPAGNPRPATLGGPGSSAVAPLAAGAPHPESLILTNPTRLAGIYPSDLDEDTVDGVDVAASLATLAADTNATVLPVDAYDAVRDAYDAWDAAPDDVDRANDVVREINAAVDDYLQNGHRPFLKSIVLVGTDEVLPMARLQDLTQTANERTFAQDLRETAAGTGGNNALLSAALAGKILSDDPYGAFTPRRFDGEWLYVPDVALGRLVESPKQIVDQIAEFHGGGATGEPAGIVVPTKTLSAGADFMTLLAETIKDTFDRTLQASNDSLIGQDWTRSDLTAKVGAVAPSITAINAHYSPQALMPGSLLDTQHPDEPNLSASQLVADSDFRRKLLFTMGCHSGFNITNYFAGDTTDFAEALASDTAGAFIGNTGFGIGVRGFNAFSQKLFDEFARQLNTASFGTALLQAKQEYLADGITNPYDYKVIAQATYFGIPQYRLQGASPVNTAPDEAPLEADAFGGLFAAGLTLNQPTSGGAWVNKSTDEGNYYSLNLPGADHVVVQDRPVQPKREVDVTASDSNLRAAGVFVEELEVGASESEFDPVLARPQVAGGATNLAETRPTDLIFPLRIADVSQYRGTNGAPRQRLNVVPAQFVASGANEAGDLLGTESRFSKIGVHVLYQDVSDPDAFYDTTEPTLSRGRAIVRDGGDVDLSVYVTDDSDISRVAALYRVGNESRFHLVDLVPGDPDAENYDPTRYTAHLDGVGDEVEVLFQAVNRASLVGWYGNKGEYFGAAPESAITASYSTTPARGTDPVLFNGPVTVQFTESGVERAELISFSINGGAERYFADNQIKLTEFGDYVIAYRSNAGGVAGVLNVRLAPRPTEHVSISYDTFQNANGFFAQPTKATIASDDPQSDVYVTVNGNDAPNPVPLGDPAYPATADDGVYTIEYTTSLGTTGREVVFVDTHAPKITLTRPAANGTYVLNQSVTADFECTDAFLATDDGCVGTTADGAPLDTASITPGTSTRSVAVTAKDAAGHVANVTHNYRVQYAPEGPCVGRVGHNIARSVVDLDDHRTIRFVICDANGNAVAAPQQLPALGLPVEVNADGTLGQTALGACSKLLGLLPICLPILTTRQTQWRAYGDEWRFTQDTTLLTPGAHRFRVFLRDGTSMDYTLRKVANKSLGI